MGLRGVLEKRRADKDKTQNALNAHSGRGSPGRHAKVRDLVVDKGADSSLVGQSSQTGDTP